MANEKREGRQRETKGGLLGKNNDSEARSERETKSEKETQSPPKISKEKAEGQHDDKPVH